MEEPRISRKVVKPISEEDIEAYQFKLGFNRRATYTLLKDNPFGYRENIAFSGTGMLAGISKCVVNFMLINSRKDDDAWNNMMFRKIRAVVKRDLESKFVKGLNGQKKTGLETQWDVENTKSVLLFSNYFLDKNTDEIYSYE